MKLHKKYRIVTLALVLFCIFIAGCFRVGKQEVKAGAYVGNIGIVGLSLNDDGYATATLYNYEAGAIDAPELNFFRDGVSYGHQAEGSRTVLNGFEKTSFVSAQKIAAEDEEKHTYTVTFAYKDSVLSDNNRTLLTGVKDETIPEKPTEPEQPKPSFAISNLKVEGERTAGTRLTISAEVTNTSQVTANVKVQFQIGGTSAAMPSYNVKPGDTKTLVWYWDAVEGTYTATAQAVWDGGSTAILSETVTVNKTEVIPGYDIAITDVAWTQDEPIKKGDHVVFKALVVNRGSEPSPNVKHGIRFTVGNDSVFTWSDEVQRSLRPGKSVWITANGRSDTSGHTEVIYWTAENDGIYTVTAAIDNPDAFPEDKDKTNDSYRKTFAVGQVSLPDLPDLPSDGIDPNINVAPADSYGGRRSNLVKVTVGGMDSPSFNAKVNYSRYYDHSHDEDTPVNIFEMKEQKNTVVRVSWGEKLNSVDVRPKSAGITAEIKHTPDGSDYAEFTVNQWGSYSVEYNGQTHKALQLFVNPDYSHTVKLEGQYYPLGTITDNAFGGSAYGSGVLHSYHHGAVVNPGSDSKINGITIINDYNAGHGGQGSWNVNICDRNNIEFNYFHIIASAPNSDGITIQSSGNIRINNCYIRTWDDGVVLKNYTGGNTNNVKVNNTVFWTDLAQSMEIGAETNRDAHGNPSIKNAYFTDIDVIHSMHKPCMSIHNMDNAEISDIKWTNIRIEDSHAGYNEPDGDGWPLIIDITNVKGGEVPGTDGSWTHVGARGSIKDVTFENITLTDWANDSSATNNVGNWKPHTCPGIRMLNSKDGGTIGTQDLPVQFINVTLGGKKLTQSYMNDNDLNNCIGGWGNDPIYTVQ